MTDTTHWSRTHTIVLNKYEITNIPKNVILISKLLVPDVWYTI